MIRSRRREGRKERERGVIVAEKEGKGRGVWREREIL